MGLAVCGVVQWSKELVARMGLGPVRWSRSYVPIIMRCLEGITDAEMLYRLGHNDGSGLYLDEALAKRRTDAPVVSEEDRQDPFYRGIDEALRKAHDYLRRRMEQQKALPQRAQRNTLQR
jgi:hypothetical protein